MKGTPHFFISTSAYEASIYAHGRPCGIADDDLVGGMMELTKNNDFVLREFIHTLFSSRHFLSK